MAGVFLEPEIVESSVGTGRWMVVIYNNESNSMDEVIAILMKATGCSTDEAYIEMWEAHTYGKAPVHFAMRTECEIVASMIATIGVKTQVRREWEE
ncbi:MAG: ATP-dependent Clp protease adaptor ClpS [Fimbriimonadaceae bacterium]|nr:ATP-dependent Clp protease adaptor ClpS [Fimbriimonadaceae bacterium]